LNAFASSRFAGTFGAIVMVLFAGSAFADTLDDVRARGALRWGGDEEGGAPYIYRNDVKKLVGFETDLMEALAERLQVRSEFVQGSWSQLPDTLDNRPDQVDVIVNGFELTRKHLESGRLPSIGYYAYELELVTHRADGVAGWDDLSRADKKVRVGVLSSSAAAVYTEAKFGTTATVTSFDSPQNILDKLKIRQLDALIQDTPANVFFLKDQPTLHVVDRPVERGFYVIYCRNGDERLRDAIDSALLALIRDGTLRRILTRYGVWNSGQDWFEGIHPTEAVETEEAEETMRGWSAVRANFGLLIRAAGMTVLLSVVSMPLAVIVGLLVALGRLYGPTFLRPILGIYVEVIRGTPLLLQLLIIFFVLPQVGILIPAFPAAILGLAINYSAYEAEIYRAGLLAIPHGQSEAALALGMTQWQSLRHVVVPQAVRLVVPPVTNDFIALFKDTAVCSVITVVELSKQYQILATTPGAYLQFAAITALLYMAMSYPLALLTRRLEKRVPPINV